MLEEFSQSDAGFRARVLELQVRVNSIRVRTLYDAYCWWMDGRGRKGRDKAVFGKELHSVLPHLTKKGRIGTKQRYVGIALNEEADAAYDRAWSK